MTSSPTAIPDVRKHYPNDKQGGMRLHTYRHRNTDKLALLQSFGGMRDKVAEEDPDGHGEEDPDEEISVEPSQGLEG